MKARRRRRGKYLGITYSGVNSKEAPQPGGKPFGRAGGGAADIDRDGAAGGDAESRGVANRPHPRQPSPPFRQRRGAAKGARRLSRRNRVRYHRRQDDRLRSEEHTSELQSLMR